MSLIRRICLLSEQAKNPNSTIVRIKLIAYREKFRESDRRLLQVIFAALIGEHLKIFKERILPRSSQTKETLLGVPGGLRS